MLMKRGLSHGLVRGRMRPFLTPQRQIAQSTSPEDEEKRRKKQLEKFEHTLVQTGKLSLFTFLVMGVVPVGLACLPCLIGYVPIIWVVAVWLTN